jgi:hypothetical protein
LFASYALPFGPAARGICGGAGGATGAGIGATLVTRLVF